MLGQAKMWSGTLTLRTDNGYVIEAPVEWASVRSESSYADVEVDALLDSHCIFTESQNTIFEARLKHGESYTIWDVAVEVEKTFAVKGNSQERMENVADWRSALGVPSHATARYNEKKNETKFTWTERVVVND